MVLCVMIGMKNTLRINMMNRDSFLIFIASVLCAYFYDFFGSIMSDYDSNYYFERGYIILPLLVASYIKYRQGAPATSIRKVTAFFLLTFIYLRTCLVFYIWFIRVTDTGPMVFFDGIFYLALFPISYIGVFYLYRFFLGNTEKGVSV